MDEGGEPDVQDQAESAATKDLRRVIKDHMIRARLDKSRADGPIVQRARGSWVTDTEGRRYLDFNSGQMSAALGHNQERIVKALREAGETVIHASTSFYNEYELHLADRLTGHLPPSLQKCYFLLSGADANEMALGLARKYTGRYEVASTNLSFHGYSDATREVSFVSARRGYPIHPVGSNAIFAPYCYRCPLKMTYPDCGIACLDASFELVDRQVVHGLAAVITEPLLSAGGVIEPPPGWLPKVSQMAHDRGALLVLDECQTGLAKLGSWWAFEQEGVIPDVMTLAKHLGGGVAVSAVITSAQIEETVVNLGFVFGHSNNSDPIQAMAAIAAIDTIEEEGFIERGARIGRIFRAILEQLRDRHELVGDVRGRGLIHGIELVRDRVSREPARRAGAFLEDFCLANGLMVSLRGGDLTNHTGNVIRMVPPMTTTDDELALAGEILDAGLTRAREIEAA